jgi:hypothetical protein
MVILASTLWTIALGAENDPQAVVLGTFTQEQEVGIELEVLFSILDSEGQPIPRDDINMDQEGAIQLLNTTSVPISASIEAATTPIQIALVIDASGSMESNIDDVKEAAIGFVNTAPSNAEIGVFSFSDDVIQVGDFAKEDQRALVVNAITSINIRNPGTGNTCIYKSVLKAIDAFDNTSEIDSRERRAIVLITDGTDSESGSCGDPTGDNIITEARQASITTQIYTIGLCKDTQCSNIDVGSLASLSNSTFGLSVTGELLNLDMLFQEVLDSLNNLFIARTNILADKGLNRVVLNFSAIIQDIDKSFNLTGIEFNSSKDYRIQLSSVQLNNLEYDRERNIYNMSLNITNPSYIRPYRD